jgi:hypothetical protein
MECFCLFYILFTTCANHNFKGVCSAKTFDVSKRERFWNIFYINRWFSIFFFHVFKMLLGWWLSCIRRVSPMRPRPPFVWNYDSISHYCFQKLSPIDDNNSTVIWSLLQIVFSEYKVRHWPNYQFHPFLFIQSTARANLKIFLVC